MMKRSARVDYWLQEQLLPWSNFAHPTLFPGVVRGMKLSGVVKIDARDVFDRIGGDVRVRVKLKNFSPFNHCFVARSGAVRSLSQQSRLRQSRRGSLARVDWKRHHTRTPSQRSSP